MTIFLRKEFPEFPWVSKENKKNSLGFPEFPWFLSKFTIFPGFPGFPGSVWTLQIFLMTKKIGWRKHFSWWCHKSIMARQKRKKKLPFLYKFGAQYMSHDKYFYGKKLNIVLALLSIYQKQKTESVYLILKNNYGPFSETHIFQKISQP